MYGVDMYDELLAAVRARVNRYGNSGDSEDVLHPAGLRDAEALLTAARGVPGIDAQHAALLLYYARHVVVSAGDDETDLDQSEPLLKVVFAQRDDVAEQLQTLAGVPARPVRLNPQRFAVFAFEGRPLAEIDAVIASTRHAIRTAADPEDALSLRMNLAEGHQLRYTRTGDVADLTDAIDIVRDVLAAAPPDGNRLTTLATFLQYRFAATGDGTDLEATIEAYRAALASAGEDDEDRPMYQSNLARAQLTRYAYVSREPTDLRTAIPLLQSAVAGTPEGDPGRGTRLHALHQAYLLRAAATDDLLDLEAAVRAAHEAVEETPPGHPAHAERVRDLGTARDLLARRRR